MATTYSTSPASITVNENSGTLTFTVTRSGTLPAETLFVSTSTGEGFANSGDYTGKLNEQLTFTSGQTSKTVTVSITNDAVVESNETFGLLVQRNSSDPVSTFLAKSTFTIADDDVVATTYSISPGSTTVNESAGTVTFTVNRSGGLPAETLFVSTSTGEGFANNGDYTGKLNEQLTFTSGQTSKTVTVSITNDAAVESNETFGLLVQRNSSDPTSTFLTKGTFTISDDDVTATTYSISPGSTSVNENSGTVTFTVTRSGGLPAETLFVSTSTGEGFANNGDYTGKLNEQLTFTSGQTSKTVTVSITNDVVVESNETFGLLVQRNSGDPTSTFLTKGTFTIADDDVAGTTYSISPGSTSVNESAGTVTFTVTRSGTLPAETLFVSTSTGEGFANNGDYTGKLNEQLTFTSGQTSKTVTVSITNDVVVESNETFGLLVQRNSGDPTSTFLTKGTFTIADDDVAGTTYSISPGSTSVNESAGTVTFTVTRSGTLPAETLFVSTSTGEGFANNGDYTGKLNEQLTFISGQTSKTVTVSITNDVVVESNETFGLLVQRNSGDPTSTFLTKGTFTIADDDVAATTYSISASPSPVNENAGTATFTITRSGNLAAETIYASTLNGSANGYSVNSSDYATNVNNLPVTFFSGQSIATVTLSITNDTGVESDETFGFIVQRNSSDPVATFLAKGNWTIHDDDAAPTTYSVSASPNPVNENAGTVTFTITRSGNLGAETIYASTLNGAANGYAVNSGDYATNVNNQPVTFSSGQSSTTVTLSVTNDTTVESDETFGFILQRNSSDPVSTFLAKSNWSLHDDDGGTTYSLTPASVGVDEGAGTRTFTITRSGSLSAETLYASTVNGAANGFATNNGDYVGIANQVLNFASGETSKSITVSIVNDALVEANETFGLIVQRNASDPVTTFLAGSTFTMQDNDQTQAPLSVSLGSGVQVSENGDYAFLTVSLDHAASQTVSVFYSTYFGTASAGDKDYEGIIDQKITFNPGEQTKQIQVSITNDQAHENTEYFDVKLTNAQGMTIGNDHARVTINDDDATTGVASPKPSLEFMAALAKAAYSGNSTSGLQPLDLSLPGLTAYVYVNDNAAALVGRIGDTLYIAFRGTDDLNFNPISQDVNDWAHKDQHYALFAEFNAAIATYVATANSGIHHVYVTGHSLGAAMAQQFVVDHGALPDLKAVTFANPGYGLGDDQSDDRITNIYVQGDIIRAADYAARVLGVNYIVHDSTVLTSFNAVSLHDVDLYYAIAHKLTEANVDISHKTLIDVFWGKEPHSYLDIDFQNNEWIVKFPGLVDGFISSVKNVFFSTAADEIFEGPLGLTVGNIYSTAQTIGPVIVNLLPGWVPGGSNILAGSDIFASAQLTATVLVTAGGWAQGEAIGNDKLINISSVMTGAGDDQIYGDDAANTIASGAGNDIVFARGGDDTIIGGQGEGNDTYDGGDGIDTVIYSSATQGITVNLSAASNNATGPEIGIDQIAGIENVIGGSGNDSIIGNSADNIIDGGAGADTMIGAAGNDTYFVDITADQVVENANGGIDTVNSSIDYTLGANLENLVLLTGATNGAGNGDHNTITGNSANNALSGYVGNDNLSGGGGNDILDGGTGTDIMSGGPNDDTYYVDSEADVIFENANEGNDTVFGTINYTLSNNFETLFLVEGASAAINAAGNSVQNFLYGNALNNALSGYGGDDVLIGGGGNDIIDGGIGNDAMAGGSNNDTYHVDSEADTIIENAGEGTDTVFSTINYTLANNFETLFLVEGAAGAVNAAGNGVQNFIYGNSGGNALSGYVGDDVLVGGAGNDILDGGIGNDTMAGGANDDTYHVDSEADTIIENANEGNDTVFATINYTLSNDFEILFLVEGAAGAINGAGNSVGNQIYGNSLNNALSGNGGADTLVGGTGNDLINGGTGVDLLHGGADNDTFVFAAGEANGDTVLEFAGNGAAAGDSFRFTGFGTAAQGATFTQVGATNSWQIHSGLDAHNEIITLSNGASVHASDYVFV